MLCIARSCTNSQKRRDVIFHRVPKDIERSKEWLAAIGRKELWSENIARVNRYRVCEHHFTKSDYLSRDVSKRLRWNAVPCLNISNDENHSSISDISDVPVANQQSCSIDCLENSEEKRLLISDYTPNFCSGSTFLCLYNDTLYETKLLDKNSENAFAICYSLTSEENSDEKRLTCTDSTLDFGTSTPVFFQYNRVSALSQEISKCRNELHMLPVNLFVKSSTLGGVNGIWSLEDLPMGTRFGPYESGIKEENEVISSLNNLANDDTKSYMNWLAYINYARNEEEQNLMAFHYLKQTFYICLKDIPANTELLVYHQDFDSIQNVGITGEFTWMKT